MLTVCVHLLCAPLGSYCLPRVLQLRTTSIWGPSSLLFPWPPHLLDPTWSCGLAPERCRLPCRSQKPRGPWCGFAELAGHQGLGHGLSPCCQKNRAIFCRFISTALATISSWKGKGKWLILRSSKSMSTSSSRSWLSFFLASREHHPVILGKNIEMKLGMNPINSVNSSVYLLLAQPWDRYRRNERSWASVLKNSQAHACLTLKQAIVNAEAQSYENMSVLDFN